MLKVKYDVLRDCTMTSKKSVFNSLTELENWIFAKAKYPDPSGRRLWFPLPFNSGTIYAISVRDKMTGEAIFIREIENGNLTALFSDGTYTGGMRYVSNKLKKWLIKCRNRARNGDVDNDSEMCYNQSEVI